MTKREMTDAEYAADPYWKATEDIIYEVAEHHANGLKWPCSECSTKVNQMLRDWFPESAPLPEVRGAEEAATEIVSRWFVSAGPVNGKLEAEAMAECVAIIKKHMQPHPDAGWVMVPKGLVELCDDLTARVWVHDAARAGLKKYLCQIAAAPATQEDEP